MNISDKAVDEAYAAFTGQYDRELIRDIAEAAAPFIAAQALRSVAWGFPASGNYRVRDVAGKLHAIADELDPQ